MQQSSFKAQTTQALPCLCFWSLIATTHWISLLGYKKWLFETGLINLSKPEVIRNSRVLHKQASLTAWCNERLLNAIRPTMFCSVLLYLGSASDLCFHYFTYGWFSNNVLKSVVLLRTHWKTFHSVHKRESASVCLENRISLASSLRSRCPQFITHHSMQVGYGY